MDKPSPGEGRPKPIMVRADSLTARQPPDLASLQSGSELSIGGDLFKRSSSAHVDDDRASSDFIARAKESLTCKTPIDVPSGNPFGGSTDDSPAVSTMTSPEKIASPQQAVQSIVGKVLCDLASVTL